MREQNRAFVLFIKWMGFKSAAVDIEHAPRHDGPSSYTLRKRFRLAFEIITAQSNKPLALSIYVGFACSLMAFAYALVICVKRLVWGISITGWASTIVSLWFLGGLILAQLGVLGVYIGNIFDQVKDRPLFIVRETIVGGEVLK
jgi:dolichol-phosphate mannosyltransferase